MLSISAPPREWLPLGAYDASICAHLDAMVERSIKPGTATARARRRLLLLRYMVICDQRDWGPAWQLAYLWLTMLRRIEETARA